METKELLLKSANEMFLQGELPQDFIAKHLPIDLLKRLIAAIYLDLNNVLPAELEDDVRQTLLLMAVLFTAESELSETDEPNVYRMYLKEPEREVYALDEVSEIENYLLSKLSMFLKIYYQEKENDALKNFTDFLEKKVRVWNSIGIVPQERVYKLSRTKALPEIVSKTGFDEETIRKILQDYEARMDRKKLLNVKSFENKIQELISKIPADRQYLQEPIRFLLDEIANGGINIREPEDLFPKAFPICKSISLSYN
jgi:hypothetical protein